MTTSHYACNTSAELTNNIAIVLPTPTNMPNHDTVSLIR